MNGNLSSLDLFLCQDKLTFLGLMFRYGKLVISELLCMRDKLDSAWTG